MIERNLFELKPLCGAVWLRTYRRFRSEVFAPMISLQRDKSLAPDKVRLLTRMQALGSRNAQIMREATAGGTLTRVSA